MQKDEKEKEVAVMEAIWSKVKTRKGNVERNGGEKKSLKTWRTCNTFLLSIIKFSSSLKKKYVY